MEGLQVHSLADPLDDVRGRVAATRSVVKAAARANRTALQFLTDLDERLQVLEHLLAQPKEAQPNGYKHQVEAGQRE